MIARKSLFAITSHYRKKYTTTQHNKRHHNPNIISVGFSGTPNKGGIPHRSLFAYHSHKNLERYGKLVWVPLTIREFPFLLGVPGKSPLIILPECASPPSPTVGTPSTWNQVTSRLGVKSWELNAMMLAHWTKEPTKRRWGKVWDHQNLRNLYLSI